MSISKYSLLLLLFIPFHASAFSISTSSKPATETGIEILREGGNAMDAMVAASLVLGVTQPFYTGIGGGGFMLASRNSEVFYWDHREEAPKSAHSRMFLKSDGTPLPFWPERVTGPNPIGVPGNPAGLYEAHKNLGKLPWKKVVEPAIRIARQGFAVTEVFEQELHEAWERIAQFPVTNSIFGNKEGDHLKRGYFLKQPVLAATLEKIADEGAATFYTGSLAKSWINEAQKAGIKITLEDLANYKVRTPKPVSFKVFGLEAYTASPPSAAGLMVAGSLRYLEHYYKDHSVPKFDSAKRIIVTAETFKFFQDLRNKNIGDPPFLKIDPKTFLNTPKERAAWKEIDARIAKRLEPLETKVTDARGLTPTGVVQHEPIGSTAHLSVIDDAGMAVSYTSTIEQSFGSGIILPGHGFLLNNELSDFDAEEGQINSAAAGKRPRSNMSPLIFFDPAKSSKARKFPVAVLGCAGGPYIPTALVQMLEGYHLNKMSAREAIAFPRFFPREEEGKTILEIEKGYPASTIQELKEAGYTIEESTELWGVMNALMRKKDPETAKYQAWEAASEPRNEGFGITLDQRH